MFLVKLFVTLVAEGSDEQGYCRKLQLSIPPFVGLEFDTDAGGFPFEIKVTRVEIGLEDGEVRLWADCTPVLDTPGLNSLKDATKFFEHSGDWEKM